MIPPKTLRLVSSIKERYTMFIQSITKMIDNHNKHNNYGNHTI
jgi:hypothetical protein